jgi:glutamine amidotransferase
MIVIIDYGMGNVGSIQNMLAWIGIESTVSSEPAVIEAADRFILPGVGAFDTGMRNLAERGLVDLLGRVVIGQGRPLLGICLGMQLLGNGSEEGSLPGLGWLDAVSRRFCFEPPRALLKVPHMGWNTIQPLKPGPLFEGLVDPRFYFVHSYHLVCSDQAEVLANAEYGFPFAAAVGRGRVYGVQFHPEKSHRFGMALLRNFAERC